MKFIVSYLFSENEEEGLQTDIVSFKDKKRCIEAYSSDEYDSVEIEEYDEDAIMEEMYCELDEDNLHDNDEIEEYDDYQDSEDQDDFDRNDEGISILFPNVETREDLEEELEHTFTRMMDN